jgi:DNA mismatch repair protein MutL
MAKIQQLSPHVADLIAAGEVVERPGSVVKELIENAIDAGATMITVEIKGGGMTYIRVTDNGCGIAAEDTETAFLRHATSKLRDEFGLEAIGTLGFRGEALAAIAAVSRIELLTREIGVPEGTSLTLAGGEVVEKAPAGCPEGTTIVVRDLFYNTPARLKFMKTDRAEGAHVSAVVLRCALSHPEISLKYIKDGKTEYHTPGDARTESCIYNLLGRDFAHALLPAQTDADNVTITGFVSAPYAARGNRSCQFFFVNGRFVKSKTLQAALEQAYKNALFTGKFPACVLYITVRPNTVDVNVHPTKTEVKFLNERQVFDGVYYATLAALSAEKEKAEIELPPAKDQPPTTGGSAKSGIVRPTAAFYQSMPADQFRKTYGVGYRSGSTRKPAVLYDGLRADYNAAPAMMEIPAALKKALEDAQKTGTPAVEEDQKVVHDRTRDSSPHRDDVTLESIRRPTTNSHDEVDLDGARHGDVSVQPQESALLSKPHNGLQADDIMAQQTLAGIQVDEDFRLIGEALCTYIVIEHGDSIWLIDKHAAHERIIFDRLKAGQNEIMTQPLLEPLIFNAGSEDAALLLENTDLLQEFGFEIDAFGETAVAVRQIPADIDAGDVEALLGTLCRELHAGYRSSSRNMRDTILHTMACKAAIKAGRSSQTLELNALARQVVSGQVRYCPHGRPVAIQLTKTELDKHFKRT